MTTEPFALNTEAPEVVAYHLDKYSVFGWNNALYIVQSHLEDCYLEVLEIAYIKGNMAEFRPMPVPHRFNGYCNVVPVKRIILEV